jgi:signal transduction histidine kinase
MPHLSRVARPAAGGARVTRATPQRHPASAPNPGDAATLAHDLRSSLASASFAAELLDTALDDPARVADLAATIRESLERTQQMIRARMK